MCEKNIQRLGLVGVQWLKQKNLSTIVAVTPDEFWTAVGTAFLVEREVERRWDVTEVTARGGPTNDVVKEIERGHVKKIDSLQRYAEAFGWSIVDLFRKVLRSNEKRRFSDAAVELAEKYDRTTPHGQDAFRTLMRALPDAGAEGPSRPPRSHSGHRNTGIQKK